MDIAVFVEVVRAGGFTSAANRLDVSKSRVSKSVTRLEQAVGARLLNRTTRRLTVTEAGSVLYDRSSSALATIEEARLAVSDLQGKPTGLLRVSASTAFGVLQLAPIVCDISTRYPELAIDLKLEDRHVDIVAEGYDLAVRITGELRDSDLIYRRLAPNNDVICASPAYLERHGRHEACRSLRNTIASLIRNAQLLACGTSARLKQVSCQ